MKAIGVFPMMKLITSSVILGVFFGFAAAQQAPEQYPGQSRHAEPPADYFCEQVGDRAHRCDCPGMQHDPMCKTPPKVDNEEDAPAPEESGKCSVYCWASHCHCKKACDT